MSLLPITPSTPPWLLPPPTIVFALVELPKNPRLPQFTVLVSLKFHTVPKMHLSALLTFLNKTTEWHLPSVSITKFIPIIIIVISALIFTCGAPGCISLSNSHTPPPRLPYHLIPSPHSSRFNTTVLLTPLLSVYAPSFRQFELLA